MKKTLLATLFSISALLALAHVNPVGNGGFDDIYPKPLTSYFGDPPSVSVYPNPATNFISINKDENIKSITVFNLVGRKMKTFKDIQKDEHYDVSNLPKGMYLVRVTGNDNKVITTQRISKR
ncbi:MAG: T9SS type A sorting domain-containing protein [Bacteroidota bacterium]